MNKLKNFFIWCSGASVDIVNLCDDKEKTKYVNIGIVVIAIALLGTFSFTTFLTFAFGTSGVPFQWAYYPIGLIWGMIILSIDRAIVSTISKKDSALKTTLKSIPRFLLALMIGLVVATPVEMFIFNKEINTEIDKYVNNIIEEDIEGNFDNQLFVLQNKFVSDSSTYEKYHQMYEDEVDGKKSGIPGKGKRADEYMVLELNALKEYNKSKDSLNVFLKNMADYKDAINKDSLKIAYINDNIGVEFRVNQLYKLSFLHTFITILFMTIELLPLMVKLMSAKGSYDEISDDIRDEYILKSKSTLTTLANDLSRRERLADQELEDELELKYNTIENELAVLNSENANKIRVAKSKADNEIKLNEAEHQQKIKQLEEFAEDSVVVEHIHQNINNKYSIENTYWEHSINKTKIYFHKPPHNNKLKKQLSVFDKNNNVKTGEWYYTSYKMDSIIISINGSRSKYDIVDVNNNEMILMDWNNINHIYHKK